MELFDNLNLAMFSGKGGVGKTTTSCAFACQWAKKFPDEKILLISTDPAHSLGDVLQIEVTDTPTPLQTLPNLSVRALDANLLLEEFKQRYGDILELLVERGSFVEGEDLTPVWDLDWPGLDELMGLLEIQRLCNEKVVNRVVVDMAPSGHTLNLFRLMDFLDTLLNSLELFQQKYRYIKESFAGKYTPDEADETLQNLKDELAAGRHLLQESPNTACLVMALPEPMSFQETRRFLDSLENLKISYSAIFVNQIVIDKDSSGDRCLEQGKLVSQFMELAGEKSVYLIPQQNSEPLGITALENLIDQISPAESLPLSTSGKVDIKWPEKIPPGFTDFIEEGKRLLIIGGKGGVGKTTIAAAIGWEMAQRHPDSQIRTVSIDPAHSLGDAFGLNLSHEPSIINTNLKGQEIESNQVIDKFREDYLWELAEIMSGEKPDNSASFEMAFSPKGWRQIVEQALPGIDEILSLLTVIELLEENQEDLIILDTAPTGHLLRFLEMPSAMQDWLSWIFKLWIKYQDIIGRTEFMGRLRTLRKRVVNAQKILKDSQKTEFIGVMRPQTGVIAEAERLYQSLVEKEIAQNYVVLNCFTSNSVVPRNKFPGAKIVCMPMLPRSIEPIEQIKGAANYLF
ncbi:MAG: TRC40/GET3/ArsA family transport-energizing ATPase [Okeania sp. SIO2C9]|uniref:ArsA family ATPase n=1 Tax=Okeania sp. SIO2C9 TaxID=2607791 RepID=UPI0013C21BF9|nr:ArsA family ATPase [Okeania sp. SIO2C9]NEQ75556.1 TRC40/GET3/ArsA family transport-energizing ATPase [Okeania sp. SIO2C9]